MLATVLGSLWLSAGLVAVTFVSWRVSGMLLGGGDLLARVTAAGILAWFEIVLVLEILGSVHLLRADAVLVAEALLAVATWLRFPAVPTKRIKWAEIDRGWWLVAAVVVPFLALMLVKSVGAPSWEWDTNHYHIVNAAHWLATEEIWSLPYAVPGDTSAAFPGNGEVVGTWLMLPFHDDRFAYVGNVFYTLIAILGMALILRAQARRPYLGALVGALVLLGPLWTNTQPHSLMNDTASVAAIAVGLGFGAMRRPALAGLALGLSMGTKYSTLIPAIVSAGYLLAVVGPSPRLASAGRMAVAATVAGAFWYLRNLVATGNPLFPLPIAIAGHPLLPTNISPSTLPEGTLLSALMTNPKTFGVLAGLFLWGTGLFTLAVLVLGALGNQSKKPGKPRLPFLWALAIIFAFLYASSPTTAPYGGTVMDVTPGVRYILGAVLLATAWAIPRIPSAWTLVAAVPSLAYDLVWLLDPQGGRLDLSVNGRDYLGTLLVVGLITVVWIWHALQLRAPRLLRPSAIGPVALVALATLIAAVAGAVGPPKVSSLVADLGGAQGAVVALYHVQNVREVLGPKFEVWNINSIGQGQQGSQIDPIDPAKVSAALAQLDPAIVVIGQDPRLDLFGTLEPGGDWTLVGTIGPPGEAARVYLTRPLKK